MKTFAVQYPGPGLVRQQTVSGGVEWRALSAARQAGWDGKSRLAYFDSDGQVLGGFNPSR